jgi:hypothetical protein
MNRSELKKFVTKVLLEKLEQSPSVQGKLVKKTVSFRGIDRECVCEGNVEDANQYAIDNELTFTSEEDSYFGGHFTNEMTSYEFQPNPEFYGELMETSMSAREQLARICGTNDQVLTEVDAQTSENLVDFICRNESFRNEKTDMVFEKIRNSIENKLCDKTQFTKLFEYLVKQACTLYTEGEINLSDSEFEYSTKLLSKRFFENRDTEEISEKETKCGKKSFTTGSAFENMQRIKSGHQMFL